MVTGGFPSQRETTPKMFACHDVIVEIYIHFKGLAWELIEQTGGMHASMLEFLLTKALEYQQLHGYIDIYMW